MKISMGSWAFSFGPYAERPVALADIARHLAACGYDGIELGGFPPHVTLDEYSSKDSRRSLVKLLDDLRLGVSGYAADFTCVNPAVNGNGPRYVELFKRQLEMCVDLGSPSLRVDSVAAPGSIPDSDYHPALYRIADIWRECAELARQAHVALVWEFEPGYVFNKPSEVVSMHERVGHPSFKILFDTCHGYMCGAIGARQHGKREILEGGIEEFIEMLDGRIGAVHVIDSDATLLGDDTSTHRPLGEGYIVWDHVAPKLLEVPRIDWWCIDLSFWPESWDLARPSLEFARRLTAGKG